MTTNQAFLQGMLTNKALKRRDTVQLWNKCCDLTKKSSRKLPAESGEGLETIISGMNRNLEITDLEIRSVYNFYEKTQYFGIVNTEEDTAVRKGTKYVKKEILFFMRLCQEIIEEKTEPFMEDDFSSLGIELNEAQNLVDEFEEDYRVSEAAEFIQVLHKERWLTIIKKVGIPTVVTFGTRSLLELPDVRKWAMERQSGDVVVRRAGEVDEDGDQIMAERRPRRQERVTRARRNNTRRSNVVEESDEEETMQQDEDEIMPAVAPAPRRSRRTRR
eukprot:Plantae.Rhodophyta-Hildenbrandia_rubra.ctg2228.p4 GENE.Plantae.Rhodophyta-Hildenbrandia_rubra.ctg2228~~Plantae.Rhodophyta-Hildenbrandia_rubra.ctg2228.p4  ORF type:complete len:274 (+),score=63.91 Plantae.Rhodophyta-Hildenbrandia_rubra.ctg2228:3941-4762(+)